MDEKRLEISTVRRMCLRRDHASALAHGGLDDQQSGNGEARC
jgi:hypothetical protein